MTAWGRQGERQTDPVVGWAELPRSPGHVFYDRLQAILLEGGFDGFAEQQCGPYYASKWGRPSLPPGRYFRMHLVGQAMIELRDRPLPNMPQSASGMAMLLLLGQAPITAG